MKTNIHPSWYGEAKVTCSCGNTFTVGSTIPEMHVEVCYNCHPFYTGEARFIDTMGRVEKFQVRQGATRSTPKKKKAEEQLEIEAPRKTLKEILAELKTQSE